MGDDVDDYLDDPVVPPKLPKKKRVIWHWVALIVTGMVVSLAVLWYYVYKKLTESDKDDDEHDIENPKEPGDDSADKVSKDIKGPKPEYDIENPRRRSSSAKDKIPKGIKGSRPPRRRSSTKDKTSKDIKGPRPPRRRSSTKSKILKDVKAPVRRSSTKESTNPLT